MKSKLSLLQRANNLFREGRIDEAIEIYEQALSEAPNLRKIINFNLEILRQRKNKSKRQITVAENSGVAPQINQINFINKKQEKYRILLVSYYSPTRAHAGGLRILDLYRCIRINAPHVEVDLYTHFRPSIDWNIDDVYSVFDNVYLSRQEALTTDHLCDLAGEIKKYDVVDLQFHQAAYEIDSFRKFASKIIFTPMESLLKVAYLNYKAMAELPSNKWLESLKSSTIQAIEEIKFCEKSDAVVCVSRPDAAILRAATGLHTVKWLETGLSEFEFDEVLAPEFEKKNADSKELQILYVAYFGSETNVKALQWYLDYVHPLVLANVPNYCLKVVGRGDLSSFTKYKHPSINIVGEVTKIGPWIANARVGVAPALSGGGFRGKINQYAVYGVPSVSSPIALKGLGYQNGKNILIAESPEVFARYCISLLTDSDLNDAIGTAARELCLKKYTWQSRWKKIRNIYNIPKYCPEDGRPLVTAVVPSYNHGRYIGDRIESILNQTYDKIEIIVIDDCSSDNSHFVISKLQQKNGFSYIKNEINSGTPFAAWESACQLAKGDYIWICESDDIAEPTLVEDAIKAFSANPRAVLFYTSSNIIDDAGRVIGHTDEYFRDVWKSDRWSYDFVVDGIQELKSYQLTGQTVPNMSSAIISAYAFRKSFTPNLKKFKLAGDWLFIGYLMQFGDVIYSKKALNNFRKHSQTARVRVKSAKSQAEYILTKYYLLTKLEISPADFSDIMSTDVHRFIHEPDTWLEVAKALSEISISDALSVAKQLFLSLNENPDVFWDIASRLKPKDTLIQSPAN